MLQDPVVSQLTFLPSLKVWKFELLHHFKLGRSNALWSNLRGMGLPVLGNDIQAAPLFPLTLIFLGLPENLLVNALVTSRLVLTGVGAFLISYRRFRFGKFASSVFVLCFAYGLYVLRWINHPWQNGFLAGVWYIYFCSTLFSPDESREACEQSTRETKRQHEHAGGGFGTTLGIILSSYGLITCGFPESTVHSALLGALVLLPQVLRWGLNRSSKKVWGSLIAGNLIGVGLASPQLLALLEMLNTVGSHFRKIYGTVQFSSPSILLGMIARFQYGNGPPAGIPIHHVFGLIPLFLFGIGIAGTIKKKRASAWDVSALMAGLFFILKCFPFFPFFNELIGKLPVLRDSWFTIYFFPILVWPFAYFAAKGADYIDLPEVGTDLDNEFEMSRFVLSRRTFWIVSLVVLGLAFACIHHLESVGRVRLIKEGVFYFGFLACIYLGFLGKRISAYIALSIASVLLVAEWHEGIPADFVSYGKEYAAYQLKNRDLNLFEPAISKKGRSQLRNSGNGNSEKGDSDKGNQLFEFRRRDNNHFDLFYIPTIENGAPAILPRRLQEYRTTLFVTDWNGYLPIQNVKRKDAWSLSSAGLYDCGSEAVSGPTLLSQGEDLICYDPSTLSRAYIPSACHGSKSEEESKGLLATSRGLALGEVALEDLNSDELEFCKGWKQLGAQSVHLEEDLGSRVTLSSVEGPAILVLNDNLYPGWHAFDRVSGQELQIKPANLTFRGVVLKEKRIYQLEFVYHPKWLTLAGSLILASLASICIWLAVYFRYLRRASELSTVL